MTNLLETGAHDWQNYVDYWRDIDAEWLQARAILRVNTPADLAALPAPGTGQTVYVKDVAANLKDVLYMYASVGPTGTAPGWVPYPALPKFLYASEDSVNRVTLGHHPGNSALVLPSISLSPQGVDIVSNFSVRTSILKVTAADIQMKTGTKNVVLTTDAAGLVVDSPIKAPSLNITGAISAASITAAAITVTGAITATGQALSVGSVAASAGITAGTTVTATSGFRTGTAAYLGDANGAVIRRADWAAGNSQIGVYGAKISLDGGTTEVTSQLAIMGGRSINWYNSSGTHVGYGGNVIYSSAEPTGIPNGTIWVIP